MLLLNRLFGGGVKFTMMLNRLFGGGVKFINGLCNDLFEEFQSDQLRLSTTGTLFEDSFFLLEDIFIRTDVFNALDAPCEIKGGYIGRLRITGFVGFGKLIANVDNVCIILGTQGGDRSEERLRRARQVALRLGELFSNPYNEAFLEECLSLCVPLLDDAQSAWITGRRGRRKRPRRPDKVQAWLRKRLEMLMRRLQVNVTNVHVRFETELDSNATCCALGITLPSLRLRSGESNPEKKKSEELNKLLSFSQLQVYCDYGVGSFCSTPRNSSSAGTPRQQMLSAMKEKYLSAWSSERHTGLLFPTSGEVIVSLVKVGEGYRMRACDVNVEGLNFAIDNRQLQIICALAQGWECAERSRVFASDPACRRPFDKLMPRSVPPPPLEPSKEGGILPNCRESGGAGADWEPPGAIQAAGSIVCGWDQSASRARAALRYAMLQTATADVSQPSSSSSRGRCSGWALGMWRFAFQCVLHELRRNLPFARWHSAMTTLRRRDQYVALFKRSLAPSVYHFCEFRGVSGNRGLVGEPVGPRPPPFPRLSVSERWTLSNLEMVLSLDEVLFFRGMAIVEARLEAVALVDGGGFGDHCALSVAQRRAVRELMGECRYQQWWATSLFSGCRDDHPPSNSPCAWAASPVSTAGGGHGVLSFSDSELDSDTSDEDELPTTGNTAPLPRRSVCVERYDPGPSTRKGAAAVLAAQRAMGVPTPERGVAAADPRNMATRGSLLVGTQMQRMVGSDDGAGFSDSEEEEEKEEEEEQADDAKRVVSPGPVPPGRPPRKSAHRRHQSRSPVVTKRASNAATPSSPSFAPVNASPRPLLGVLPVNFRFLGICRAELREELREDRSPTTPTTPPGRRVLTALAAVPSHDRPALAFDLHVRARRPCVTLDEIRISPVSLDWQYAESACRVFSGTESKLESGVFLKLAVKSGGDDVSVSSFCGPCRWELREQTRRELLEQMRRVFMMGRDREVCRRQPIIIHLFKMLLSREFEVALSMESTQVTIIDGAGKLDMQLILPATSFSLSQTAHDGPLTFRTGDILVRCGSADRALSMLASSVTEHFLPRAALSESR